MRSHSFKRATSTLHDIAMELVTWPTVKNVREMNQNWMQPPSLSLMVIKQLIWMWKPTDRCWELQESCRDSWKKYELSSRQIELHLSKKYSGGSPGTNSSQSCRIWKEILGNRRLKILDCWFSHWLSRHIVQVFLIWQVLEKGIQPPDNKVQDMSKKLNCKFDVFEDFTFARVLARISFPRRVVGYLCDQIHFYIAHFANFSCAQILSILIIYIFKFSSTLSILF